MRLSIITMHICFKILHCTCCINRNLYGGLSWLCQNWIYMHNDHDDIVFFPECAAWLEHFLSEVTMTQSTASESLLSGYTTLATDNVATTPASNPELLYLALILFTCFTVIIILWIATMILLRRRTCRQMLMTCPQRCLDLGKEKKTFYHQWSYCIIPGDLF